MAESRVFFSEYFGVPREVIDRYGAFDINLVSDLPLFVDPFLLFNSARADYQELHDEIIEYLRYLRGLSEKGNLTPAEVRYLYRFKEVHQNWFGYTYMGNRGHGLGRNFAVDLHESLKVILANFGNEGVTRGSHLEKLTLIRPRVGKDNISDFTTNLIKHYLVEFTERFARDHLDPEKCATFGVDRVRFNYDTGTWVTERHFLPRFGDDYVLLTPVEMLTHDDTWINHPDMVKRYPQITAAIEDAAERSRVSRYFESRLGENPKAKDKAKAASETFRAFPWLLDLYIKFREDNGDEAKAASKDQRDAIAEVFVNLLGELIKDLLTKTKIAEVEGDSYSEALERVRIFRTYVEDQDGWRLLNRDGRGAVEKDVQLFFGLALRATKYDINREANNGRGPVDFAISKGSSDKTLIEIKLARSSSLEHNLQNQLEIYQRANQTDKSVTMIVGYTEDDLFRVNGILSRLRLTKEESIVVVNARADDKPSGSKAR
jgi:hypothetical protein